MCLQSRCGSSNETSAAIRRVEEGEKFTVTVSGRPVAQLVPLPRRRRYLTWEELVAVQADRGLLDDLREMLPDTTDDVPGLEVVKL